MTATTGKQQTGMFQPDRYTVIVGLGKTGLSCARYLARLGTPFAVIDSRPQPPGLDELKQLGDIDTVLGTLDTPVLERAKQILLSPGLSLRLPAIQRAVERGVPVLGDIELFAHYAHAPVVAITGSNGKSTVTTLVGEMLAAAGKRVKVGGNLGTPALELLDDSETDAYVLELSSFQLETTYSLQAASAVVLNISPDHMDRYDDVADYANAKARIYQDAVLKVVNRDDPAVCAMVGGQKNVIGFTLHTPKEGDYGLIKQGNELYLARGSQALIALSQLRIAGLHNAANALAALALCEALGAKQEPMLAALKKFTGLSHRCQWVAEQNGVRWYNDSKGTNVGATEAAVAGIQSPLILIAGGQGKGADFSPLRAVAQGKARAVILLGEDADKIEAALAGVVPVHRVADMAAAVHQAATLAQPGDAVLLSPACASFDMFKGYDHRGEVFMQAVRRELGL